MIYFLETESATHMAYLAETLSLIHICTIFGYSCGSRHRLMSGRTGTIGSRAVLSEPVSYTHLDVYKRQIHVNT